MSILLISAVLSTAIATDTSPLYDEDIKHGIAMITTELVSRHNEMTCWEPKGGSAGWLAKYNGGTTAVTTLALLCAGYSMNTPEIQASLKYLSDVKSPSTYVLATRISVWSMMPERYKRNLKKDTRQLVSTLGLRAGSWGNYSNPPTTRSSASPLNREFGMIALREAERNGQRVPKKCWMALADATLATQQSSGGWAYGQSATSGTPSSNMTVAALNCLLGVDEIYGADLSDEQANWLHSSIERALSWLNEHATTEENVGGTTLMSYLYGLERAAMSCGLAEINKRDWFQDGARAVIKTHCGVRKAKGSTINLAFGLLFLSRGRVPVALCELATNKGSIDPLRTTETIASRLSEQTERELSWQTVTNKERLEAWQTAPLLFIQDTKAIPNTTNKLKRYLDAGGLIVMLGSKKDFIRFSEIANTLCPKVNPENVANTHWSLSILNSVKNVTVRTWNDGIRDRVLLVNGLPRTLITSPKSKLSQVLVNICCGAAELDNWKPRVAKPLSIQSKKTIWLGQHEGHWNAEMTGLQLWKVKTYPIEKINKKNLVLIGGLQKDEATDSLAKEILRIASNGSTVLVESIGGRGNFASSLQQQIENQNESIFKEDDRFKHLTGQRGWSIRNQKKVPLPMRTLVETGEIVIINCDVRNALLNQTAWGIHGYDSASAVELIETLLED
jgi:hypothetical protein